MWPALWQPFILLQHIRRMLSHSPCLHMRKHKHSLSLCLHARVSQQNASKWMALDNRDMSFTVEWQCGHSLRVLERNLFSAFLTGLPQSLVSSWLVEEVSLNCLPPPPVTWCPLCVSGLGAEVHCNSSTLEVEVGTPGHFSSWASSVWVTWDPASKLLQNLETNKRGITSWIRIFPNQAWLCFVYTSEDYIVLLFIGNASKTSSQMDVWNGRVLNHIHTFFLYIWTVVVKFNL